MALSNGSLEHVAHVWTEKGNLRCQRHLFRSITAQSLKIIFELRQLFSSTHAQRVPSYWVPQKLLQIYTVIL